MNKLDEYLEQELGHIHKSEISQALGVLYKKSAEGEVEKLLVDVSFQVIKDKITPDMHYLGAKLININDEGTKGAVVFGFKLGRKTVEIVTIYNNGQVKGQEMMYLSDDDLFVPLTQEWVDIVQSGQKVNLGEPGGNLAASKPTIDLFPPFTQSPVLPPNVKFSSHKGLREFMAEVPDGFEKVANLIKEDPETAYLFLNYYPKGYLAQLKKEADELRLSQYKHEKKAQEEKEKAEKWQLFLTPSELDLTTPTKEGSYRVLAPVEGDFYCLYRRMDTDPRNDNGLFLVSKDGKVLYIAKKSDVPNTIFSYQRPIIVTEPAEEEFNPFMTPQDLTISKLKAPSGSLLYIFFEKDGQQLYDCYSLFNRKERPVVIRKEPELVAISLGDLSIKFTNNDAADSKNSFPLDSKIVIVKQEIDLPRLDITTLAQKIKGKAIESYENPFASIRKQASVSNGKTYSAETSERLKQILMEKEGLDEFAANVIAKVPGQYLLTKQAQPIQADLTQQVEQTIPMGGIPSASEFGDRTKKVLEEFFESSMISKILAQEPLSIIDDYITSMILTNDKLARLLLILYWVPEKFQEQYSMDILDQLELLLKNAFSSLGQIIATLYSKRSTTTL